MSNKYTPHLIILSEDDAYRQIAQAFRNEFDDSVLRKIEVHTSSGGWSSVLDAVKNTNLMRYPGRYVVVLLDFDKNIELRRRAINEKLTEFKAFRDRIFVIGARDEAETLCQSFRVSKK